MTKKRNKSGKNRRHFVAIPFSNAMALGTLADETVQATGLTPVFGEDIYIISVDITAIIRDLTGGEVPLYIGLAHGDLSVGEILEALNAEVINPDDIIARERARRPVRKIGGFADGIGVNLSLNDGRKIRQKVGFSVGEGFSLDVWIKNQSGATLTTGAILEIDGVIYGRWQR